MSEPKKETVRIVLPPRRDGQPPASSSRETAMINLPPKPVQKPGAPECGFRAGSCERAARISAAYPSRLSLRRSLRRRAIRAAPRSQAALDCGRGTPRSQTAFHSAHCSEATFCGWGSSSARPNRLRSLARRRSLRNPGHSDAVGVNRVRRLRRHRP